ncbi:ClpXP protease specificity-enhancing factor [Plesiomonas shigelloides subsp. oncorhynchi]|jgi:stringent starvation protein B|uniref:Stringent starvation protein B n=2 Tax=Plesiomonas shigelloides TaxID=703 RepID=R8AT80_PLESH|nr:MULTISPECIES: ClpXP protease specificity-enhancing factor [Plesiomonas]MDO4688989.1 ClpXP protease specificity-enhancing factor [Plesiomonas sp.]AVQ87399.1 ClpXP protease specificity-enhancing factor [Plesiomonas shigelloides]EON89544.1 ClpXP protease specificity-enhancing factor [Plesiomonas shigelloides 302-73]KAB7663543.1 ClpXP protease specificity-enhancing factor [Plesiomonas shigelloides]KAB7664058.1 ClpXP protease specificity-enhancing factor [Plesiomonas shigelloides]
MELTQMKPRRPYLVRAYYDWLLDNNLTPHLVVDAMLPGVQVPMDFVRDGQIVLNIAPRAVGNLELGNDAIRFNARFGGIPQQVDVPMAAVLALYARENGAGTLFEPEVAYDLPDEDEFAAAAEEEASANAEPNLVLVEELAGDDNGPDDEPPRPRGRPTLRVVK